MASPNPRTRKGADAKRKGVTKRTTTEFITHLKDFGDGLGPLSVQHVEAMTEERPKSRYEHPSSKSARKAVGVK
jgi:hypothetical protein